MGETLDLKLYVARPPKDCNEANISHSPVALETSVLRFQSMFVKFSHCTKYKHDLTWQWHNSRQPYNAQCCTQEGIAQLTVWSTLLVNMLQLPAPRRGPWQTS